MAYSHPAGGSLLSGVAAASWRDVWAVGSTTLRTNAGQALVEHWNGTNWSHAPSPGLCGTSGVGSVAASSASNVWAVGSYDNATNDFTFALHCG